MSKFMYITEHFRSIFMATCPSFSALELSQYWYYLDTWLHHKVSITRSKTVNTKLFKQKSQFRQAVNVKQR